MGPSFAVSPSIPPLATPTVISSVAATASLPTNRPTIIHSAIAATGAGHAWDVYLGYPSFEEGTTPWAQQMNADIRAEVDARASQWEQGPAAIPQSSGKMSTLYGAFTTICSRPPWHRSP